MCRYSYVVVFQTSYAKIGIGICWDQWFPECARALVLQGAEILLYPTAIGSEPKDETKDSKSHWQLVMQGHSAANMVPIIAANRIGREVIEESDITFYGSSFITNGCGEVIASADRVSELILTADLNLDQFSKDRSTWYTTYLMSRVTYNS
jgi:N-carbamoylputrescine amidase